MRRYGAGWRAGVLAASLFGGLGGGRAVAWQDFGPGDGYTPTEGMQVLTRGPVHEAFAEPVVYDPRPGPVFPNAPPQPVQELPPDQRPVGVNVQWIPGYWAWDDSRNDFIWISGLWRDVPPGRQWVPGYWAQVETGFQWVPGAWTSLNTQSVQYLPAPPASLEAGPPSPPPSPGATWSPGCWVWQEPTYVWRPGFWVDYQPDWVWVPAHYVWSPGGYLFSEGYWDRPLVQRGTPFAPVYFTQPVYQQRSFAYTPTIGLMATALATSLFVRPSYNQYYFGDYYSTRNFQSGIYPWYSYHQSRYGSDPLFAHYAATNLQRDPQWVDHIHDEYRYRRDHPEARPPHTYNEYQQVVNRSTVNNITTNINNNTYINNTNITRNLAFAAPLNRMADTSRPGAARFTQVSAERRREFGQQAAQIQQFREQRSRQEVQAMRAESLTRPGRDPGAGPNPALRARRVEMPVSPIVGTARNEARGPRPPEAPRHPAFDPAARPRPEGEAHRLPEPHPDARPQPFPRPGRPGPEPGFPRPERDQPRPRAERMIDPQPTPRDRPQPQPRPERLEAPARPQPRPEPPRMERPAPQPPPPRFERPGAPPQPQPQPLPPQAQPQPQPPRFERPGAPPQPGQRNPDRRP